MNIAAAIVLAGALIAGGILARNAMSQATTYAPALAWVVATCGTAPTVNIATGWKYTATNMAPLTMNANGSLCVNQ